MKAAPLQKRTPGASFRHPQKFIHALFQTPSALIVLLLTLILTGIAWHATQRNIENNARDHFERNVVKTSRAIEERIQTYIDILLSARSLFAVNQNMTRADWKRYTETLQLHARYPGIYSLVFARYVPGPQRASFEKQVRNDTSLDPKGYPDFSIHPEGERPDYFPIEYTEPFSPIPIRFGFDIGSDPVRREALEQARDTGQPVSTGRIGLVGLGESGFAVRVPVYRNGLPRSTVEERRRALLGFVAAAFQMERLMKVILSDNAERDLQFEIFDGGTEKGADPLPFLTKERLLYDSDGILTADTMDEHGGTQTVSLTIAGRIWYLYFSTRSDFGSGAEERVPFLILFSGLSFSFLLSYITWSTTTARRRAIALAETMTADLRESEARFHLATCATNEAVWDWNLVTNALWWNENFQTLFGYRPEEIESGIESWTNRLHPEDKAWVLSDVHTAIDRGKQFWSGEYRFRRGDGSYAAVLDRGYIVRDAAGAPLRMIGAMMDITERKEAEEALRIKTDQLAAVTDAMTAYLDNRDWRQTVSLLLRSALHQTESEYGFIGVVVEGSAFRILAVEGIDAGPKSRPLSTEAPGMDGKQEYLESNRFDNLFGRVIQSGKVVLSNDAVDPKSGGIPPGHPSMRNFLGVPIIRENKVVGMIGVMNRPGGYSGTERDGLEILSHATGILYDNYRRREREIALEHQQKSVEKELRRSQEQLRSLSSRLHSMVEEERTRISREIHDELGQLLTILKMELSWLKKRLPKKEALLQERTKSMAKLVDTIVQTLRKISTELRPGVLDDLGLTAAIEWQVQEFKSRTGIRCRFTVRPEEILLDPDRSTAVFRIFQETLTNVVRHANADEVAILLEKNEENLILEVKDNGRGIVQSQITNSKSLGLLGIRERALLWGGTVQISGVPGKGTIITVQIPLHQPTDAGMKA